MLSVFPAASQVPRHLIGGGCWSPPAFSSPPPASPPAPPALLFTPTPTSSSYTSTHPFGALWVALRSSPPPRQLFLALRSWLSMGSDSPGLRSSGRQVPRSWTPTAARSQEELVRQARLPSNPTCNCHCPRLLLFLGSDSPGLRSSGRQMPRPRKPSPRTRWLRTGLPSPIHSTNTRSPSPSRLIMGCSSVRPSATPVLPGSCSSWAAIYPVCVLRDARCRAQGNRVPGHVGQANDGAARVLASTHPHIPLLTMSVPSVQLGPLRSPPRYNGKLK